ncbi:MAG: EamA family transporter [Actinomycetota bacterium]|nr:EamA family transporter [Actinomycetota bacterium]
MARVIGARGAGRADPAAVAMVVGAAGSVQFGAAFAVTLFDRLGPAGATLMRLGFAALILVALWRPTTRGHGRGALTVAAAFGLSLGLMNWSFYEALARIPLGVAVSFEFVGPLSVALLKSRKPRDVLWVLLAGAGIALLGDAAAQENLDPVGILLALFAGACWAAYILLSARTGAAFAGGSGLALAMVVATLVVIPAGAGQASAALLAPALLLSGLVVALASSVIPYSLELEALRRLPANVFGVLLSLDPAIAALAGFALLRQTLSVQQILAITLVVAASAGVAMAAREVAPIDA